MSVKITMTYDDGIEKGRQVTTTETWIGNVIPLAKITTLFERTHHQVIGNKLQKVKVVRELRD